MESYSISEIKKELNQLPAKELVELCIRLSKYKKENKELLNYLLYYNSSEELFIQNVKSEIDFQFTAINKTNMYFAKKTVRKVLRTVNKYAKYSGKPQTHIELLIYFVTQFKRELPKFKEYLVLENLYYSQLKKINTIFDKLHEDLQYDYAAIIESL